MVDDKIKLLPESVSNQIAAGEVVNRPSSVVKEMVENSLDAGATEIIINFRNGGQDLIQIVDNGAGMSPNDARMAFEKHATSKINEAEDIYALHTFGFRGEALASIAAVSQVELRSRPREAEIGTRTTIEGSIFMDQQPDMCEVGSQFFIRNLFFNIPARRKFVDKVAANTNQIKAEFRRIAICNPSVSFELYIDDALSCKLCPTSSAGRIVDVVGRSIKSNLLEVKASTKIVNIEGYIGKPEAAKKGTQEQYLYVNGRFFRSSQINRAIVNAYEKIIPAGMNPSYFIFLEVRPDEVDVNIHPQKTEVKFADESGVWQILNAAVRETLARTNSVPAMEFENVSEIEIPVQTKGVQYAEPRTTNNGQYNPFSAEYSSPRRAVKALNNMPLDAQEWESGFGNINVNGDDDDMSYIHIESSHGEGGNAMEEEEWQTLQFEDEDMQPYRPDGVRLNGEISVESLMLMGGRYAVCRVGAGVSVVDLIRAKEQLLFTHYTHSLTRGEAVSQTLLFPIELQLSHEEFSLMEENAVEFAALGFNITAGANCKINVMGLPSDVGSESVDRIIYDMLQQLATPQDVVELRRRDLAASMAYNASHATSQSYTEREAREIVAQLLASGECGRTPKGKSIMWEMTTSEIKQKLG
ncbi:MAG: DNA mismatch repair endonuclease MutL [Rikenellaceae bacterium]